MKGRIFLYCFLIFNTFVWSQNLHHVKIKSAYDHAFDSINGLIAASKSNSTTQANLKLAKAKIYHSSSQYNLELREYLDVLQIFQKGKNYNSLVSTYVSLAELYRHLIDFKEMQRYIDRADRIIKTKAIDPKVLAKYYDRKAAILIEQDTPRSIVKENANLAIKFAKISNQWQIVASSYNILGYACSDVDTRLNYYFKSLHISDSIGDKRSEIDVIVNISRAYTEQKKDFNKSNAFLQSGLSLFEGDELPITKREYYRILTFNYGQLKKFYERNKSADSLLKYAELALKIEYQHNLEETKSKYNLEQKESLLQTEKEKSLLLKIQYKSQHNYLITTILIILLLIFFVAIFIYAYLEIRRTNKDLSISNHQKDVLIQEVHHRVKNNFQMVSGLLQMQLRTIPDENSKKTLEEAAARIHSMGLIHQQLYSNDRFDEVSVKDFLKDILFSLTHSEMRNQNFYVIQGDNPLIHIEQAIPLGIIIHEMVTNSLKYAWTSELDKKIIVHIQYDAPIITINYRDNGKGLPKDFNLKNSKSLGLKLINLFIERQLKGNVTFANDGGAKFIFTFELR